MIKPLHPRHASPELSRSPSFLVKMDIPFVQHVFDASDAKASIIQLAPFLFQDSRSIDGEIRVATLTEGTTNAVRLYLAVSCLRQESLTYRDCAVV